MKTIKSQAGGKEVEYRIYEYLNEIIADVRVNGKHYTRGKPEVYTEIVQGRQIYGRIASVFVSKSDVWAEIWTAYTEAKEQLESSGEYKVKQLRTQREKLAYDLKYANDELSESEQRQVEAAMQGRSYRYDDDKLNMAIVTAKAALSAFDETHPEIIAGIRKERDERTERNMWN
jgi:hypothetical protein